MANSRSRALGLLALALQGEAPGTDGELLTAFLERRDATAFATLMERHGPMVFGVCQRILQHRQDAEDAFQATFVVLARKAASISPRNAVGNWLYGVAFQTAIRQRSLNGKRLAREALASKSEAVCADPGWDDLSLVLDEELSRVPSHYRAVLVLCDVEGRTQIEAARHLGCPEGTVSSRLCRARAFLAKKLTSRGITLTTAAVVMLLDQHATATIPSCLSQTAAASALSGKATAAVATLSQGVLNAMVVQKIKLGTATILMCGLLGLGGLGSVQALRPIPATEPQSRKEPTKPDAVKKEPTDQEKCRASGNW